MSNFLNHLAAPFKKKQTANDPRMDITAEVANLEIRLNELNERLNRDKVSIQSEIESVQKQLKEIQPSLDNTHLVLAESSTTLVEIQNEIERLQTINKTTSVNLADGTIINGFMEDLANKNISKTQFN